MAGPEARALYAPAHRAGKASATGPEIQDGSVPPVCQPDDRVVVNLGVASVRVRKRIQPRDGRDAYIKALGHQPSGAGHHGARNAGDLRNNRLLLIAVCVDLGIHSGLRLRRQCTALESEYV